jgi:hypothetical protein
MENHSLGRVRRVRLDEERGMRVDVPEHLVPDAKVWGSPEEPRVPIDAGVEIGYRDPAKSLSGGADLRAAVVPLTAAGDASITC